MNTPMKKDAPRTDANRDPISGEPGAHPIGTGLGAAAGGVAAGALVGSVAGPVGTVVGAAVGAVAGGLAGHAAGEAFNPSVHDGYWREAHTREPYYKSVYTYDDYAPGYRTGYEAARRHLGQNRRFEDLESEQRAQYERTKGKSRLVWEDAKHAARAAWNRVERVMPGDSDNDGR